MIFVKNSKSAIVIECKNYSVKLDENKIVITSKYLGEDKIANLGFIFTRIGFEQNAIDYMRDRRGNPDGMFVGFTDSDLIIMIQLKDTGKDPSSVFWKKIQELYIPSR